MPMTLKGGCRCGAVTFSLQSHTPHPYQLCYCSICRKTAGGGGFAINIMGDAATLEIDGGESLGVYRAELHPNGASAGRTSSGQRNFCTRCGSALWLYDPTWPDLVHPHASAIDTDLPVPPSRTHIMLGSKAAWVEPDSRAGDQTFDEYPEQSIEDWHRQRGLWVE